MSGPPVHHQRALRDLPAFSREPWQMSYGERSTIEGVLAMVRPRLAIEIGRAEGGSLRRIAAYSEQVISFDVVEAAPEVAAMPNVRALAGDSHVLLPEMLKRLAEEGQNVDFVLVDGDHTAAGVRADMQDLLDSPAIGTTVILAHDTLNEDVRQGLTEVGYDSCEKVAWVDLDFIPGYVARLPARLGECWGGLGLVVVDSSGDFREGGPIHSEDLFEQPKLVWPAAGWIRGAGADAAARLVTLSLVDQAELEQARSEAAHAQQELERHRLWLHGIEGSLSWRLTAPLRALKRRVAERLG